MQHGNNALIFAAESGHVEVVKALLAKEGIAQQTRSVGHVCTANSNTTSHDLTVDDFGKLKSMVFTSKKVSLSKK